jgi:hypothetical protein
MPKNGRHRHAAALLITKHWLGIDPHSKRIKQRLAEALPIRHFQPSITPPHPISCLKCKHVAGGHAKRPHPCGASIAPIYRAPTQTHQSSEARPVLWRPPRMLFAEVHVYIVQPPF